MTKETISQIESIRSRINTHPEYSHGVRSTFIAGLIAEANKHSSSIELQAEAKLNGKKKDEQRVIDLHNLDNARSFLVGEGVTLYSLGNLGHLVEPKANPGSGFRIVESAFGGFAAPDPRSVPQLMDDLVYRLNDISLHPISRAIESHISLVKIHPFLDGNGRAARLLQNFCLEQKGYTPAIIFDSERQLYLNLINGALIDRLDNKSDIFRPSDRESIFHEFIASKILSSTRHLEEELKSYRSYDITLNKVKDPAVAMTVRKMFKAIGKRSDHDGITTSTGQSGRGVVHFNISGDIGLAEVRKILDLASEKYKITYNARPAQ